MRSAATCGGEGSGRRARRGPQCLVAACTQRQRIRRRVGRAYDERHTRVAVGADGRVRGGLQCGRPSACRQNQSSAAQPPPRGRAQTQCAGPMRSRHSVRCRRHGAAQPWAVGAAAQRGEAKAKAKAKASAALSRLYGRTTCSGQRAADNVRREAMGRWGERCLEQTVCDERRVGVSELRSCHRPAYTARTAAQPHDGQHCHSLNGTKAVRGCDAPDGRGHAAASRSADGGARSSELSCRLARNRTVRLGRGTAGVVEHGLWPQCRAEVRKCGWYSVQ